MTYLNQISRAIDYIEDNLMGPLAIADIAREAGLSKWYFQRIFRAMVGDTVKEYILLRRLSHAARALVETDDRIIDIALNCDFGSPEVFSRAFRRFFGQNPQSFRKAAGSRKRIPQKPKITTVYLAHLYRGITMEPEIKHIDTITAIGMIGEVIPLMSQESSNNMQVIPALWQELHARRHDLPDCIIDRISVIGGIAQKMPDRNLEYLAGVMVSDGNVEVPEGMTKRRIPAGEYAVFTHRGPVRNLGHTKNYIYGSWLPKSGRERADGPQFSLYSENFDPNGDQSEIYLHIPLG